MKIQDLAFIALLAGLLYIRKPKLFVVTAIILLILSMPLFQFWVFFTAQRFVEYAFFLLLIATLLFLFKKK
ncbi:MAG: hypothetical protein Q7T54_01300 [Candidatus Levybacteria bacterium]|nr:hypothetical protein [Candidatus Levybacteria bacterium]